MANENEDDGHSNIKIYLEKSKFKKYEITV